MNLPEQYPQEPPDENHVCWDQIGTVCNSCGKAGCPDCLKLHHLKGVDGGDGVDLCEDCL